MSNGNQLPRMNWTIAEWYSLSPQEQRQVQDSMGPGWWTPPDVVLGPTDMSFTVDDIPKLEAGNMLGASPQVLQRLYKIRDQIEAWNAMSSEEQTAVRGSIESLYDTLPTDDTPTDDTPTDTPTDTPPGAQNQEGVEASVAAALEAAGLGPNFNFSDFMTAADAKELFQGMDTGQIEANVLQKMGLPDFLTNQQVQEAINKALGETDSLSEDDVLRMIQESTGADVDLSNYMSKSDIAEAIKASTSQFLTPEMIQQMITNAQLQGMSEEDIFAMIQEASGGMMSDEDIMAAIATAQETQYTSLMDEVNKLIADSLAQGMSEADILTLIQEQYGEQMTDDQILQAIAAAQEGVPTIDTIQQMINEALTNGMSPEDIATMIGDYVGDSGLLSADEIATMIADAVAGIGATAGGDALTSDAVQQMIDAAISGMPAGLSTEDVQTMLGESGYMGDTGVQGLIDAALQGSLGEGGSISQAIQAALAATGGGAGTDIDTGTYTSPYGTYTSPYGDVDPYALMHNPWYGTTPFAGGTTTGAEDPTGLGDVDLGNPADYNFDISTAYDEDLFS